MTENQRKEILETMEAEILDKYDGHIANINTIRNELSDESDKQKYVAYMDASTASKNFFSTEPETLLERYLEELDLLSEHFGDQEFSPKQKILNYMEYIRLNCMYENISKTQFNNKILYPTLSQTGLNVALLGKGVCRSQAQFLSHLLICSGENAYNYQVTFSDKDSGEFIDAHEVVTAEITADNSCFLDPTYYNGTVESLQGSFESADITPERRKSLSLLNASQHEIDEAREVVQQFLIKRYGIEDISSQLGLAEVGDMEKQIRILAFMEKNLAPTTNPLTVRSVVLGNREIEVGKLLELFYKANDIPYSIECEPKNDKKTSIYKTMIDGQECKICPVWAYSPTKPLLTKKLHFFENENGENNLLLNVSQEQYEQIGEYIRIARGIAETITIPKVKDKEEMDKWEFIDENENVIHPISEDMEQLKRKAAERIFKYQNFHGEVIELERGTQEKLTILTDLYQDSGIETENVNKKNGEIRRTISEKTRIKELHRE